MDDEEVSEEALEEPRAYDQDPSTASARVPESASVSARLVSIWDCPQVMKLMHGDKRVWTCGWCPNESNGTRPKPFLGWNATKAISHVCRSIPGMCIRLCSGTIPPDHAAKYKDHYLRQVLNKEKRSGANEQLDATITDIQDSAVSAMTLVNPPPSEYYSFCHCESLFC